MGNRIFALDIGTRTVTGIILEKNDDKYKINDFYTIEHKERSMLDGQIHNVEKVAEVILEVKKELEKRTNTQLKSVCVAAAGRALETIEAKANLPLNQQPINNLETIKHLELSAVQAAQLKLTQQETNTPNHTNYYCVGYSVIHYQLDHEQIGSLLDQRGDEASVQVIATFLPKVVVESLLAALTRADLEMEALTLEPIAAIQVLIPESMRRLNVALVDIGAGTSDIAITDKGTVVAYGMVPVAGDEITESLSDEYLLDFPVAEKLKREIVNNGEATFNDILGFETEITYEKLVEDMNVPITQLATEISKEIMKLNGKIPRAVMLIGGGSLTPELTSILAETLDLPANRVAVRGLDAIQNLHQEENIPKGPEFVTPIGIAIAAKQNPIHYISVNVNNQVIRLFEMKQLTVGDCLIQVGIEIKKSYGKPGIASIITVNGQQTTLPGELGKAPNILLNGNKVTVETPIANGDELLIEKGEDGKPLPITLHELIGEVPSTIVYLNDHSYTLQMKVYVNDVLKDKNYIIQDNDNIIFKQPRTISDFLTDVYPINQNESFIIWVNNRKLHLNAFETQLLVNDKDVSWDYSLKQNDRITLTTAKSPIIEDVLNQLGLSYMQTASVTFNGTLIEIQKNILSITNEGVKLDIESKVTPNDKIEIHEQEVEPFIFQDIFRYVDIDLTTVSGAFQIYNNDEPSSFDALINHGDKLEIRWSE
ncbi:cell division protein FtsA [Oceanobacillus bengalensis]|uniref:Cell division protein FtsA n=1 Tax=Oceanobacillus bengalensis TaxID=1435466 RepID=A0A494YYV3_9BACI|nr:cell division protein FtsA [Oceanobacillus bengalensis]RKQ14889.1 cell division protein FtsA [Oceanobacillus bengalensis]